MTNKYNKNNILEMTDIDRELAVKSISFGEIGDKDDGLEILIARLKYYTDLKYINGVSLKQLGEESGVNDSYLNKIIRGAQKKDGTYKPVPSIDILNRLSYTLEIKPIKLIQGLERIIKCPNISINDMNLNDINLQIEYMKKIENEFDVYRKDKESKNSKIKLIPVENFLKIEDNSMNSFNIIKDSNLLYTINYKFINGNIYVLKYLGTTMVRRVWKIESFNKYILIPCANNLDYSIIEVDENKIEIIGMPINVTISI